MDATSYTPGDKRMALRDHLENLSGTPAVSLRYPNVKRLPAAAYRTEERATGWEVTYSQSSSSEEMTKA